MLVERARARARPPRVVERVGREVARHERAVAGRRPGRELERLVAVRAGPGGDLLERALGHAGGQEAELHAATSDGGDVDPALARRPTRSTASVMRAARSAVGEGRQPVGRPPGRDRRVDVGDEAGRSSPGSPAGGRPAARRAARPAGESAPGSRRTIALALAAGRPTASRGPPGRTRAPRRAASTSSHRRFLRPAETWLTTTDAERARRRSRTARRRRPRSSTGAQLAVAVAARERLRPSPRAAARARRSAVRAREPGDPVAGDELDQVAPVRADVGERARRAAERRRRRASCRPRRVSSQSCR